ncbi:hypothetical protein JJB27_03725 [Campylobacter fetus subsp. venerealis]|uniref:hypothetical protein n=1 Tax=Campylobacter fetus TaxID=196 RepID=UPI000818B82E|nr:hypothetical protein [Campylobacter fetus]MBK3498186.1 hypothetical protein [Campylobacter fetus subsp. venerealis]MBK3502182.1 hypothetical protein [Campylobacter fetus subsp. venerealis]OCS16821.1 hypothetical protein CfvWBT01109_01940 [Campylobacter fetus subsp. venerealis]
MFEFSLAVIEIQKEPKDELGDMFPEFDTIDELRVTDKKAVIELLAKLKTQKEDFKKQGGVINYFELGFIKDDFKAKFNNINDEIDSLIKKYENEDIIYRLKICDTLFMPATENE